MKYLALSEPELYFSIWESSVLSSFEKTVEMSVCLCFWWPGFGAFTSGCYRLPFMRALIYSLKWPLDLCDFDLEFRFLEARAELPDFGRPLWRWLTAELLWLLSSYPYPLTLLVSTSCLYVATVLP